MNFLRKNHFIIVAAIAALSAAIWVFTQKSSASPVNKTRAETHNASPTSLADLKPKSTKKLADGVVIDKVLVQKSIRTMSVYQKGVLLKQYTVSLGFNPIGHKQAEGDGRTPEGIYRLDWRNPKSAAYLSFHINYPNEKDKQVAQKLGVSPGGDIMVHGLYNSFKGIDPARIKADWTNGCVAVSNAEMDELWRAIPDGTLIEIQP